MSIYRPDGTITSRAFSGSPEQVNDDDVNAFADIALAIPRGIEGAVQGIYGLADFVTFDALPDYDERFLGRSQTGVGGFVESATQFMTGFIPVAGQLGKIGSVARLGNAAKLAQGTRRAKEATKAYRNAKRWSDAGAGLIADFSVFDAHEARLSDFIQDTPLANPVSEFLAADKNDNELLGRLKNSIEGLFVEVGMLPVGKAFTATLDRLKDGKALREGQAPEEEMIRAFRAILEGDVDWDKSLELDNGFDAFVSETYKNRNQEEFLSVYDVASRWLDTDLSGSDPFAPMLREIMSNSEQTLKDTEFGALRVEDTENGIGGLFDPNTRAVLLPAGSPADGANRQVFLHEVTHSVTTNKIDSTLGAFDPDFFKADSPTIPKSERFLDYLKELESRRSGLSREDPVARLVDAYIEAVTQGRGTKGFKDSAELIDMLRKFSNRGNQTYGYANIEEFAAEFMSNRAFAKQVGVEGRGRSQKLYARIMEALRDLLGISTQYRGAFNDALSGIQGIVRESEAEFKPLDRAAAPKDGSLGSSASKSFEDDVFNNRTRLAGLSDEDLALLDTLELEDSMKNVKPTEEIEFQEDVSIKGGIEELAADSGAKTEEDIVTEAILNDPKTGEFLDRFPPEKRAEAVKFLIRERILEKGSLPKDITEESIRLDEPSEMEFRRQLSKIAEGIPEETTKGAERDPFREQLRELARTMPKDQVDILRKLIKDSASKRVKRDVDMRIQTKTSVKNQADVTLERENFIKETIVTTKAEEKKLYGSYFSAIKNALRVNGKLPQLYENILNQKVDKDGITISLSRRRRALYSYIMKDLGLKVDDKGRMTPESIRRLQNPSEERKGLIQALNKLTTLDEKLVEQQDIRLNSVWRANWVEGQTTKPQTKIPSPFSKRAQEGTNLARVRAAGASRFLKYSTFTAEDPATVKKGFELRVERIEDNIKRYEELNNQLKVFTLKKELDLTLKEAEFFAKNNYTVEGKKPLRALLPSGAADDIFTNPEGPRQREPLIVMEGERIMGTKALDNAINAIGSSSGMALLLRNVVADLKENLPASKDTFEDLAATTEALTSALGGKNETFASAHEALKNRGDTLNEIRYEQAAIYRVLTSLDDSIRTKAKELKEKGSENISPSDKADFLEQTDRLYELTRVWNLYGNQLGRSLVQRKALLKGEIGKEIPTSELPTILKTVQETLSKSPLNNKEIGVQGPRDSQGVGAYVNQKGADSAAKFDERLNDFSNSTSVAETTQIAKGMHGSKMLDIVLEYWTNSILSGPTTQVVNIVGNGALFGLRMIETTMGAALTGNLPLLRASIGAAFSFDGFAEALKIAWKAGVSGDSVLVQGSRAFDDGYINQPRITARGIGEAMSNLANLDKPIAVDDLGVWSSAINFLGKTVRLPSSFLAGGDEFFKQINYRYMSKTMLAYDAIANKGLKGVGLKEHLSDEYGKILQQGRAYNQENLDLNWFNANIKPRLESGEITPEEAKKLDREYRKGKAIDAEGNAIKRDVVDAERNAHADAALRFAKENTFTEDLDPDTVLGAMARSINGLKRNDATKFMSFIIPFVRTPTNIVKTAIDRTPAGVEYRRLAGDTGRKFLSMLTGKQAELKSAILSEDPIVRAQAAGQYSTAAMFSATALYYALQSSHNGVITGGGPADSDRRTALQMSGWQPYSIRIGDKYWSYNKLDPMSSVIGIYVDMVEAFKYNEVDDGFLESAMSVVTMSVINNIANKSFLQGISNVLDVLKDPLGATERAAGDIAAGFVPTAFQQVMNFKQVRELKEARGFVDRIIKRTPYSDRLMPKRNALGEKILIENTVGGPLVPSYVRSISDDPVDQEIARLNKGFSIPKPKIMNTFDMRQFVNEDGQTAYDSFQQKSGNVKIYDKTLREALNDLIKSPYYKRLDAGTDADLDLGVQPPRVKAMQKIINRYRNVAKNQMFREFPELQEEMNNLLMKRSQVRNGIQ